MVQVLPPALGSPSEIALQTILGLRSISDPDFSFGVCSFLQSTASFADPSNTRGDWDLVTYYNDVPVGGLGERVSPFGCDAQDFTEVDVGNLDDYAEYFFFYNDELDYSFFDNLAVDDGFFKPNKGKPYDDDFFGLVANY